MKNNTEYYWDQSLNNSIHIFIAPCHKAVKRRDERLAYFCKTVFHLGRYHWVNLSTDKLITLKILQSLREHLLWTVEHVFVKFREPQYVVLALANGVKDEHWPLITKLTNYLADWAGNVFCIYFFAYFSHIMNCIWWCKDSANRRQNIKLAWILCWGVAYLLQR